MIVITKENREEWKNLKEGELVVVNKRICEVCVCKICKNKFLRTKKRSSRAKGSTPIKVLNANRLTCCSKCMRKNKLLNESKRRTKKSKKSNS